MVPQALPDKEHVGGAGEGSGWEKVLPCAPSSKEARGRPATLDGDWGPEGKGGEGGGSPSVGPASPSELERSAPGTGGSKTRSRQRCQVPLVIASAIGMNALVESLSNPETGKKKKKRTQKTRLGIKQRRESTGHGEQRNFQNQVVWIQTLPTS